METICINSFYGGKNMAKKMYGIIFFIFVVVLCFMFVNIGYDMYTIKNDMDDIKYNAYASEQSLDENTDTPVLNMAKNKITPSTKMVYKYFYTDDKVTEIVEDVPAYFLIDLTREDLEKNFENWRVQSFSEKEVVLEKTIEGESLQHYIVGEYDGYVAIYYKEDINGKHLKDITNIPIESLSDDEREEIEKGLCITGESSLIKLLENYES